MAAPLRSPSRFKMQKVKPVWSLCYILQARDIPTAVSEDACGDLITNIRLERSVFDKVLINSRATQIPCNTKKKRDTRKWPACCRRLKLARESSDVLVENSSCFFFFLTKLENSLIPVGNFDIYGVEPKILTSLPLRWSSWLMTAACVSRTCSSSSWQLMWGKPEGKNTNY